MLIYLLTRRTVILSALASRQECLPLEPEAVRIMSNIIWSSVAASRISQPHTIGHEHRESLKRKPQSSLAEGMQQPRGRYGKRRLPRDPTVR